MKVMKIPITTAQRERIMAKYKTLDEAFASIDYGMCSLCQAKHEFPDVKCEFTNEKEGK
jgi:hypothetical protein